MKAITLLSMLGLFMMGCSSSPTQTYRPANYSGSAWVIAGNLKPGLVDAEITVNINNTEVIKGKFSDFQDTAEFTGKYEDYKIDASCSRIQGFAGTKCQCTVFVDGERAAILQF